MNSTTSSVFSSTIVSLDRPTRAHGRQYTAQFYLTMARSLFRHHRLSVTTPFPRYTDQVHFSSDVQQQWFDLFKVPAGAPYIPFTYFSPASTWARMKCLTDLQVQMRHVWQLKSVLEVYSRHRMLTPGTIYSMQFTLDDVIRTDKDSVVLAFKTTISDQIGQAIAAVQDFFVVTDLPTADLDAYNQRTAHHWHSAAEFLTAARQAPVFDARGLAYKTHELFFSRSMAKQYGQLSGEINPMHTAKSAAQFCGYQRPVIQGHCAVNSLLKTLICQEQRWIQQFEITFCRPLYVNQTAALRYTNQSFDVHDPDGNVLAFGSWSGSTKPRYTGNYGAADEYRSGAASLQRIE